MVAEAGLDPAVAWEPDDDASNQMHMVLDVNVHGTTMGWIVCDAPDTGSFEISALRRRCSRRRSEWT